MCPFLDIFSAGVVTASFCGYGPCLLLSGFGVSGGVAPSSSSDGGLLGAPVSFARIRVTHPGKETGPLVGGGGGRGRHCRLAPLLGGVYSPGVSMGRFLGVC